MTAQAQLKKEILAKVEEYYRLVHGVAQAVPFVAGKTRVNSAGRVFDQDELVNLVDSSLDFWLTAGRYAEEFSGKLEDFYDVSDVILTNSGSSSNLLAVSALTAESLGPRRLAPGDEVITVAAGFPSTVAPIVQNRLIPVVAPDLRPDADDCQHSDNAADTPAYHRCLQAKSLRYDA
jgi:CDP-6-deoxy-D-xylo-4-hexulose-3-dehydrase